MNKIIDKRWFFVFELATAVISGAFWFGQLWFPHLQLSWEPLLVALLPWVIRLAAGRFPFRRTLLDYFMVVFLVTAVIGVWAAYDPAAAWAKFWLIVASILVYYAVSNQPPANLWLMAHVLSAGGMVAAGYFLLTFDWQAQPARFAILNTIGLWVMDVRPALGALALHPNVTASFIAMAAPFGVAIVLRARSRRNLWFIFALACTAFLLFSLLLTESRGTWLAFFIAMGLWLLWSGSKRLAGFVHRSPGVIFVGFLLLGGVFGLIGVIQLGNLGDLVQALPGPGGVSRLTLMRRTTQLIADWGLIGSGLATFSGLYSQYILSIPFFFIGHGHNLFLNVMLEQGFLGFLALIAVLGGSFWSLVRSRPATAVARIDLLRWATIASFLVMFVHGLVDDALYGQRGTPLLFLLAGMAVAIGQGVRFGSIELAWPFRVVAVTAVSILLILLYVQRQTLLAQWYANRGAIEMARIELQDWPSGRWDDGRYTSQLAPAVNLFERALVINPEQRTAHHRLGLIAMSEQDFATAVMHLEQAHQIDPGHRGITKSLGYAYVWNGQFEQAQAVLASIPESRQEMQNYVHWWQTHDRNQLAESASQMVDFLQN